ncbi:MAG: FemAB family XrtA/PEP-CTERM system-associated protein [Gemmatimonadales bacterium]
MTLTVAPFSGSAAEWDTFAATAAGSTHCHAFGWKALLGDVFGHECLYYEAREAHGALAGVLPLVRVKSLLFGHYLVSMPFLNYGGPLGHAAAVQALADHARAEAERSKAKLLELRSRTALPLDFPVSHRKVTVVLELPPDADTLWKAFPAKLRSQIRRPQKEGLVARFGSDQVAPFFSVFSRHMRHLGTPTLPLRFFQALGDGFPEQAWFGCVYSGNAPVAGGAGFRWGGEFEMTWASSLSEHARLAPNMLLYWAFMEHAIANGLARFNFGRCTPGGGTHRFKRQWEGHDEPLWWYQVARGGAAEASTPSPDDGAYAWGPRIWRRLPLPLATALGPRIVRFIP